MSIDLRLESNEIPLLIDLYELTVSQSLLDHGFDGTGVFDVMVRRMPPTRGFLVAAGLERVLEALEEFHFDASAIDYLKSLGLFHDTFLDFLSGLRFTGSVRAMPEGTIFFANEPILEVSAPLIEAQLIETMVLNQLGLASIVATKAARCCIAAEGRRLVEFGLRRAQGADAGLIAARSSYLAGFDGSSNVLAGKRYGIPIFGTMLHSYVMAHDSEAEALADFVESFPTLSTLLVDTYDTVRGIENAAALGARLKVSAGAKIQGVRLDSGDLGSLSRSARRILDRAGLNDTAIFASGNLDEFRIADLVEAGAPIDAFGVGTALVVSDDAPSADLAYKLAEYAGRPRIKTSAHKLSLPGRKQVFRALDGEGRYVADRTGLIDETGRTVLREFKTPSEEVVGLLETQFEDGRRLMPRPTLAESRERMAQSLAMLHPRYKALSRPAAYPTGLTAALNAMVISEKLRAESLQERTGA